MLYYNKYDPGRASPFFCITEKIREVETIPDPIHEVKQTASPQRRVKSEIAVIAVIYGVLFSVLVFLSHVRQ